MKITIAGSVTFAKKILKLQDELETLGHGVYVTDDLGKFASDPTLKEDFEKELRLSKEYDIIRSFFKKIEGSDALLVANYEKNGVPGYFGVNVLMEIGVAHYLEKKIYLLNPIDQNQKYALEIGVINPIIINGDLSKIK